MKVELTDPMMFLCLVLSAMKLQASTHCLISGAAWAKLLYRLAVPLTSMLSTERQERKMFREKKLQRRRELKDVLPMERVRPCLSLCLSNIISLRGCFITYSSARCIRPKELRRRSRTPLTSVVTSLSSTSGDRPRKRGTISRNTLVETRVLLIGQVQSHDR